MRKMIYLKLSLAVMLIVIASNTGTAATYSVCPSGCDFTGIQAAINAASTGDTITVKSGIYYERVNIDKRLTLLGIDTGGGKPVVDAGRVGNAFSLTGADGIALRGFYVTNASTGIWSIHTDSNYINDNTVTNNRDGIVLAESRMVELNNNTVTNNDNGIYVNDGGENNIGGNTVTGSNISIYIYGGLGNSIIGNTVTRSNTGIYLAVSYDNDISNNTASNNNKGIYLNGSGNNILYQNDLINNRIFNARDDSGANNRWNSTSIGNHYSNYDKPGNGCIDANNDGICDAPYKIPGSSHSIDYYPISKTTSDPQTTTPIPEFPIIIPSIAAILSLIFIMRRRGKK